MKKILVILFLFLAFGTVIVYSQSSGIGIFINLMGVDNTPPNVTITKIPPTSARNITLNGSYQEDGTISNITIEVNSSYKIRASINTALKTWNASINLTEGWNRFYVLAYDAVGNLANVTSSSQGASVLSDTIKPSINLTAPQNMSSVAANSPITFKISDLSLAGAFYTINSNSTRSFNSVYEIKAAASDWVDGANYVIVNATDSTNNIERKNFTFFYSNTYEVVLNASVNTVLIEINNTNETISALEDSAALASLVNNFAAEISVAEYNKTLQALNVVANISNAVSTIQALLQDILAANASGQDDAAKTAAINAKLDQISIIKNTTISSLDVNLFNPNLSVQVGSAAITNVTNALAAAIGGLSSADENSFIQASAALQDKTTILNKVQVLTQTFLNGRTQNVTLFEKNVTISETQSGRFYINEFIDKNITGNNDLMASTGITNRVSQPLTVVVDDPTVRWEFSDSSSAVVSYSVDGSVPSDNAAGSKTVITTVPSSGAASGTSSGTASGGAGAAGGGGGGTSSAVSTNFNIDKVNLKVLLRQGESKKETLSIKNTGTTIFDVSADLTEIMEFLASPQDSEYTVRLNPNEEKIIELVFKALENKKPDIYPAKITFKSPSTEKEIDAIFEVDSAQPLFDVDVAVLAGSKRIFPGQEVILEVNLFNVRGFGRVDVTVDYSVKDLQGNSIVSEHETVAVETQAKFTRSLSVPTDLKPGTYVAVAKVTYADSVGTGSDLFEVQAKEIRLYLAQFKDYRFIIILGAAAMIAGILIFSAYQLGYFRKKLPKTEVEEVKQLKADEKAQKLGKELEALESAYKSGFISEESYKSSRQRIEGKLKMLK